MLSTQKLMQQFLQENTLRPASYVSKWNTTLIVAPHPHDEVLGCGGAISLLRQSGFDVKVLYITHGHLGNPEELNATRSLMKKIRERETLKALERMGLSGRDAAFLHIQDGLVPEKGEPGFEEAARLCLNALEAYSPHTVLLPCRFHQYSDHYASWEVMQHAIDLLPFKVNSVEYMIWKGKDENQEFMSTDLLNPWRLDIESVMDQKVRAITELRSQKSEMLRWSKNDGDTDSVAGFAQPWETFMSE